MEKTVIGVIGGGNVGRIHVKDIVTSVPEAELRYVAVKYTYFSLRFHKKQ